MKNKADFNHILVWLQGAAELPGKGPIMCALLILEQLQLNHRTVALPIPSSSFNEIGLSRHTAARALRELEKAELIDCDFQYGQDANVSIVGL